MDRNLILFLLMFSIAIAIYGINQLSWNSDVSIPSSGNGTQESYLTSTESITGKANETTVNKTEELTYYDIEMKEVFQLSTKIDADIKRMTNKSLSLTDDDIRVLLNYLSRQYQPKNQTSFPRHMNYSRVIGLYSNNSLPLKVRYFCSDVCPEQGRFLIVFQNVSEERCEVIKGFAEYDWAWGSYLGCGMNPW